jgi:hypothetical protein
VRRNDHSPPQIVRAGGQRASFCGERRPRQRRERDALLSAGVEIGRVKPARESGVKGRPFAVDRSVPGGIPIAALDHRRLSEDAFKRQAKALRRRPRRRIEGIAFPLAASVTQFKSVFEQ